MDGKTANLVVIQDMFDTYESMQIFLEAALRRRPGCQALVFNYPGQANTTYRTDGDVILNNTFISDCLHEMLQYLENRGSLLHRTFRFTFSVSATAPI